MTPAQQSHQGDNVRPLPRLPDSTEECCAAARQRTRKQGAGRKKGLMTNSHAKARCAKVRVGQLRETTDGLAPSQQGLSFAWERYPISIWCSDISFGQLMFILASFPPLPSYSWFDLSFYPGLFIVQTGRRSRGACGCDFACARGGKQKPAID